MNEDRCNEVIRGARILVIVVLYKMQLIESQTVQGLLHTFTCNPELHQSVSVLIWDNSPTPLKDLESLSSFFYKHSKENLGISGACNRAMQIAEAMGCQWLLLLDQDTVIPANFLPQVLELACKFLYKSKIAAVVPILMDGDRILSPFKVQFKRLKPFTQPFEGVYSGEVSAANSGTLIKIYALQQIDGFNEDFWLDYSDVVMFHLLHQHGEQVYIAADLLLEHNAALLDFKNSMSPERYASFIAAEGAYWDKYGTVAERALHTSRILERAFRQKRRFKDSAYAQITLIYFFRRLFLVKKYRLRWWKLQSLQRDIPR